MGDLATLANRSAFDTALARLRKAEWVVYAKRPFAGPEAVLAYLARYTHRVAISNSRLIALNDNGVAAALEGLSRRRQRQCQDRDDDPPVDEFIRRFLLPSCPTASTASATTACSLAVCGPPPSPSCAPCSPYRTAEARAATRAMPLTRSRRRPRRDARAAAVP